MTWKTLVTVIFFLYFQKLVHCQIEKLHRYSKDFVFVVPANTRANMKHRPFIMTSPPLVKKHSDYLYVTNINCGNDIATCQVEQHCLNCPKPNRPRTCLFELPSNDSSIFKEANLLHLGYNGELVVVDWVTKAIVEETTERKIQLVDLNSCEMKDILVNVSYANNKRRKIVVNDDKYFELFYVDFQQCESSNWVKLRYDMVKNVEEGPHCILGIMKSSPFTTALDVVKRPNRENVILDEDRKDWYLYSLPDHQNYAKELFNISYRAAGSPNQPRLAASNDSVVFCSLPDTEFFKEVHCVTGAANGSIIKNFTLNFPYTIRDFEVQINGTKVLYVLTSSSQETEVKCNYDLWAFEINNESKSGPIKIEGPPCIFEHRLEPRPVMTIGEEGDACVSFAFQHKANKKVSVYPYDYHKELIFTVLVECFTYHLSKPFLSV